MEAEGAAEVWKNFSGQIAAVLSGGGARGAYEVGALLAFQDARLPTHIMAASSVGSINAASFAARAEGNVGNAEHLAASWKGLTPPQVGIEWTRYLWVLVGIIAASAGFGNFIRYELELRHITLAMPDPALTWIALGVAGCAVLIFYDRLPYLGYVLRNALHRTVWEPDREKINQSLIANFLVFASIAVVCWSLHLFRQVMRLARADLPAAGLFAVAIVLIAALIVFLRARFRHHASAQTHRLLRLPLRSGLFQNFERERFLRQRISMERLRASPIRVIFTATDLSTGEAKFFSNKPPEELARGPGADEKFALKEVALPVDLMRAILASSALPIVYEPMPVDQRLYFDGAIVTNQPIRPAVRLGADVLFIIMMDSPHEAEPRAETFIDVGLRALDFLLAQNLTTDLRTLALVNGMCERVSRQFGFSPEEVEVDFGARHYRYVRAYTIRPHELLIGTALDFNRETIEPATLRGYQDASAQIEAFLAYAREKPRFVYRRHHLLLTPEHKPPT